MGIAKKFLSEKLVIGVLVSDAGLEESLLSSLTEHFGALDYISPKIDFTYTSYYNEEMGSPITRFFVAGKRLVDPESLAAIKRTTNAIEAEYAREGKRKINLDPGLVSQSRFILASTKDSSHRVPLSDGIYAEICLVYERGSFRPVEWTYADYRSTPYIGILNEIREIYRRELKAAGDASA
jgi:hypothetical protein